MTRPKAKGGRRRPAITRARASRLHRLVSTLGESPRERDTLLTLLAIGLRTFYRELDLLRRCGIKVRLDRRQYILMTTGQEAEGRLPFPDPQLSFAEMTELAQGSSAAALRMAELLAQVVSPPTGQRQSRKSRRTS